eukprot:COSAG03_NODE_4578_length_1506_cov_0.865672_1_plen_424_part_10
MLTVQSKYSASQRISLVGVGEPVDADHSEFTWAWTASLLAGSIAMQRVDLEAISTTPSSNQVLVIRPGSLSEGASYRFRLEVNDGRATGLAQIDILMNTPPAGGTLSVVPTSGTAITETFVATASLWADEDIPLNYAFGYIKRPAGSGSIENALTEPVNSRSASVVLPAGSFWLTVVVSDSYGASARAQTEVEATAYQPAPHSDIAADAEELVSLSVTNSNGAQATQLVSAFAGALADQTASGLSETQLQSARQTRSVLASGLSKIAAGAQNSSSGQLVMLAQATSAVASEPEQVSPVALQGSVNALSSLGSAQAMEGKVKPPHGAQCNKATVCSPHCRTVTTCVDSSGAEVTPIVEPVDDALISSVVNAISSVHAANLQSIAAPGTNSTATATHAESLRSLVRKSQAAMTAGVFAGEAIKKVA